MSMRQISFPIRGMYCARCAVASEQALLRLDGVMAAHVNYATERATVTYDSERVSAAPMVGAVREAGYDVARVEQTLSVRDLPYATSARTVQNVLSRGEGVTRVAVDLAAGQVRLERLAGSAEREALTPWLARLGLHAGAPPPGWAPFAGRLLLSVGALLALGLTGGAQSMPPPLVLGVLAAVGVWGAGWPFYRRAASAIALGQVDAGVIVALLGTVLFAFSVMAALFPPVRLAVGPVWAGFSVATALTAGWFAARGITLWWAAGSRPGEISQTMIRAERTTGAPSGWRYRLLPPLVGVIGALALIGLYLGIIAGTQSPGHALEQLAQDRLWVGLVALGFGAQVGLYAYLRLIVQALKLAGATAITGLGTGASTLGMLACCAHHATDFAPLVVLMGSAGLSGAVSLLMDWKYPLIALGLAVNLVGIVFTLRAIRASRARFKMLLTAAPAAS